MSASVVVVARVAPRARRTRGRGARGDETRRARGGRARGNARAASTRAERGGADAEAFVFGIGFLGRELARELRERGFAVRGTTRAEEAAAAAGAATEIFTWDGDRASAMTFERAVARASVVVSCVPPVEGENAIGGWVDPVYEAFAETLARGVDGGRFFGYCSTTSVYGGRGGGWVDESSSCEPVSAKARARLEAEERWRALGAASDGRLRVARFRLGGIYGPGRSAFETAARRASGNVDSESASSRARDSREFTSRVHVRDAANVIASAALAGKDASDVYNVVDDYPTSRQSAVRFAGQISGIAPGDERETARASAKDVSPRARGGEKRVRNDLIKRELARFGSRKCLEFPSAYHGLRNIAVMEGKLPPDEAFDAWFDEKFPKLLAGEYDGVRCFRVEATEIVNDSHGDAMEMKRDEDHGRWYFEFVRRE